MKSKHCIDCGIAISRKAQRCKSCANKLKVPYWTGKFRTVKTKQKISETKNGTGMKNQNGFYGRTHTKDTKQKMSLAKKGRKLTEAHKLAIKNAKHVHHIDGNHLNNEPSNLMKLTNIQHQLIFKTYYNYIKKINQIDNFKQWIKKEGNLCDSR